VRKHFWEVVARGVGGFSWPVKNVMNCCIPAVVRRTVGSLCGMREELA
jgi:hypothetical protein